MNQFQGFGGLVHPTRMIRDVPLCLASFCTNTVYRYIHVFWMWRNKHILFFQLLLMFVWNLWGSVHPTMLRTNGLTKVSSRGWRHQYKAVFLTPHDFPLKPYSRVPAARGWGRRDTSFWMKQYLINTQIYKLYQNKVISLLSCRWNLLSCSCPAQAPLALVLRRHLLLLSCAGTPCPSLA